MRRQTKCSHWCGAACLLLAAAVCVSGFWRLETRRALGRAEGSSYEQLQAGFAGPDMIYAPFAFWFWDEPLQQGKAGRMAAKMMEQRLNRGIRMGGCRRAGTPDLPIEQWLSEAWFDEFEGALDAAEGREVLRLRG